MHEKTLQKISTIKHCYQILDYISTCKKQISIRDRGGADRVRTKISLWARVPFILSLTLLQEQEEQLPFLYFFQSPRGRRWSSCSIIVEQKLHIFAIFFSKAKKDLPSSSDEDNFKDLLLPDTILCQDSKYKFLGLPTILGTLCLRHITGLLRSCLKLWKDLGDDVRLNPHHTLSSAGETVC